MVAIRALLTWAMVGAAIVLPVAVAATSPLLAWRSPVYVAACFAGIVALALVFLQPLLAGGYLPGLTARRGRRLHATIGAMLVGAVVLHVAGLWLTSPPDVIDALLFASPTPFSVWGVAAMWAIFAAALLAALRFALRISPRHWRLGHTSLAVVIVLGSVIHSLLVEGIMGTASKGLLCALAVAAILKVLVDLRPWAMGMRKG